MVNQTSPARTLWFDAPYQVSIREGPLPSPAPRQVLVQTLISAISAGTELLFYRGQVPAEMAVDETLGALQGPARYPLQYGYACVGRVAGQGAAVPEDWNGRLVLAFHPHASHFLASPEDLYPVPEGLAPEQAVFLPNMETAVNLVMDGAPRLGERAAVCGQGVVGLLTTMLLAEMPLEKLVTFDRYARRRELARSCGATDALDPATPTDVAQARAELGEAGADLAYELSGSPEALNLAIELTGYAGRIVLGSWYGQKRAPLDLGGRFHRSRIRILSSQVSTIAPELTGRWTKRRRMDVAWAMLKRHSLAGLITQRIPVTEAAAAYALLDRQPDQALQVLLTYN